MTERILVRTAFTIGFAAMAGVLVTLLLVFLFSSRQSDAPALADESVGPALAAPTVGAKIPTRVEYRDDLAFFDPMTGTPAIWYYKMVDGEYHLFDSGGYHPTYGKDAPLQAVSPVIVGDIQAYFRKESMPVRVAARRSAPRREARPQVRNEPIEVADTSSAPVLSAPVWAPRSITIPAGTRLEVVLDRRLSTATNNVGDTFPATLTRAVVINGENILPENTRLVGEITDLARPGKVSGVAKMTVALKAVSINGEGDIPIATSSQTFEGEATKTEDAAKVGIGAGIGAALGAIFGGKRGAAKGSVIGAGGGTGVVLATRGEDLVLQPEQRLTFTLNREAGIQR